MQRVMSSIEFYNLFGELLGIPSNCISFTIKGAVDDVVILDCVTAAVVHDEFNEPRIVEEMKSWKFVYSDDTEVQATDAKQLATLAQPLITHIKD